jgi:hypothetical protein
MARQQDEQVPDPGRSPERIEQDRLLDREARRESWLTRLLRQRWLEKGRPKPGNSSDGRNNREQR